MGKFDAYYEQLKSKMLQTQGRWRERLQKAVADLKTEQQASVPQDGAVREDFDYAQKCKNAITDCAAEKIRKEASWNATVRRVGMLIGKPELQIPRGSGNWLVSLMKTDGSSESRNYNEKIVGQMALCTGRINPSQYITLREGWYGQFEGDFRDTIVAEEHTAARDLLNALDGLVQKGRQQMGAFQQSVNNVTSMTADEETLKLAFEVIESDEIRIMDHAQDCLNDIKSFKKQWRLPKDDIEKKQADWPSRIANEGQMETLRESAEQMTDWYYVNLLKKNGEKKVQVEEKNEVHQRMPEEPKAEAPQQAPEQAPEEPKVEAPQQAPEVKKLTKAEKYLRTQAQIDEHLKPYGLTAEDGFLKNKSGCTFYRSEKTGETIILKTEEIETADGFQVRISDDIPGRYVNFDLAERMSFVKNKVKYLEVGKLHTAEYLDLMKKTQALEGLKFDDDPSLTQAKEAYNQFSEFQKSLEKFVKMRNAKPEPGQNASWYRDAVQDLKGFSTEKLIATEMVIDHIATKNQFELDGKEIEAAINSAQQKEKHEARFLAVPDVYINTAIEWSEQFASMTDEWEQGALAHAENRNFRFTGLASYFKAINAGENLSARTDKALLRVLLGEDTYMDAVAGIVGPEELADMLCKNALACEVTKELMKLETQMVQKGNPPIKDLVNGGQVFDVINMVKNSQSFAENYRFLDLSAKPKDTLQKIKEGGTKDDPMPKPEEVAKEILKSYLKRQRQVAQNQKQADGNKNRPQVEKNGLPVLNNGQVVPK